MASNTKRGVYINKWEQPSYPSDGCPFSLKEKSSNNRCTITVQQDSSDTVTTELPVTLNCNRESLKKSVPISTEDKRMLSNRLEFRVAWKSQQAGWGRKDLSVHHACYGACS